MSFHPLDARRPGDLIRTNATLKSLFIKAGAVERLQILLDTLLEPAARDHCRVASMREGVLRLIVSDSHWATRMRYQQKRLVRQLQAFNEFATLTKIHCKVQPVLVKKPPPAHNMRKSAVAAETLHDTATQVTNPALRAALERLAQHHTEK
jgi:hypothetical protein